MLSSLGWWADEVGGKAPVAIPGLFSLVGVSWSMPQPWEEQVDQYRNQIRKKKELLEAMRTALTAMELPELRILESQNYVEGKLTEHCPTKRITDPRYALWISEQNPTAVRIWLPHPLVLSLQADSLSVLPGWEVGSFEASNSRYRLGSFRGPKGRVVLWGTRALDTWRTKAHIGLEGDYEFDEKFSWSKTDLLTAALSHDDWLTQVGQAEKGPEGPVKKGRTL